MRLATHDATSARERDTGERRAARAVRRPGRVSSRFSAGHLRADFLEEVYPGEPNRVVDRGLAGLFQLGQFGGGFIRPVAHPAVGEVAALEEEISLVVRATAQGKGFADDDGLTPVELLEELDLVIDLAGLGIQMRRDKIELFGSSLVRAGERKHPHRDQVRLVVLCGWRRPCASSTRGRCHRRCACRD